MMWTAPTERLTDASLLVAVGLGDADAATVFVRRFQSQVYGLAMLMCRDVGLAEDVAQQTFERAWRHAGAFDEVRGSVRTWLLTICRRLAIDTLRLRRAVPTDPEQLSQWLAPSSLDGPECLAVRTDEVKRAMAILAELTVVQQRAVLLATMGGHTAVEIAEIESVPVGTAKTRLRTGLLKLRAELAAELTAELTVEPNDV